MYWLRNIWYKIQDAWDWFLDHTILYWIGIIILSSLSICLIFNQQIKGIIVHGYKPSITLSQLEKNENSNASYNYDGVKDLTLQNAAKARADASQLKPIGVISVPSCNVNVPIAKGTSNNTLALAAGTMRPDMKMGQGNYALAGHNMANNTGILFTPLFYKAKKGQKVYISNFKKVYEYQIYQRMVVAPSRVDLVRNTKARICTLVMCDETGNQRVILRGKLKKIRNFENMPKSIQKDLSKAYTNVAK